MTPRDLLAPRLLGVLLLGAWLLLPLGARGEPSVLVPMVLDLDSGGPDSELLAELELAARLQGKAAPAWVFGQAPKDACKGGCVALEISGRRARGAQYLVVIKDPAGGERRALQLALPEGAPAFSLAQLLMLKARDLLEGKGEPLPPEPPAPARPSSPPSQAQAPARAPGHPIQLLGGAQVLLGLDRQSSSVGPEVAVQVEPARALVLKATLGWQFLGRQDHWDRELSYQALPFSVLGGTSFKKGRWTWTLLAGPTALQTFASLGYYRNKPRTDLSLGAAAELRTSLRPLVRYPGLALGFSLRPSWHANPATVWHEYSSVQYVSDGQGGFDQVLIYNLVGHRFPAWMLGVGLDCSGEF